MGDADTEVRGLLGVHDRLRIGLRSRCEDELRHRVGARLSQRAWGLVEHVGEAGVASARAVVDDEVHRVEPGRAANLGHEVAIVEASVLGGGHDDARRRGLAHVAELLGPVVREQRVDDAAEGLDRDRGDHGLVSVRQLDGDHGSGADADGGEVPGDPAGVGPERGVGARPGVVDDGDVVGSLRRPSAHLAGEGGGVPPPGPLVRGPPVRRGHDVSHHPTGILGSVVTVRGI